MDTIHRNHTHSPTATLVVPDGRNGPVGMGNGGWTSGLLAHHLGGTVGGATVEVTLRRPTPLGTAMIVVVDGDRATMRADESTDAAVIAEAVVVDRALHAPSFVGHDDVTRAEAAFAGFHDHPFPTCVICGTAREAHDGLRIFTGPVPGREGVVAGWWRPSPTLVDLAAADGRVVPEAVWGALDCPTGWAHAGTGSGVALLGRLTTRIHRPVMADVDHVVVAERGERAGRKLHSRAGIFGVDGTLVAQSEAVWLEVGVDRRSAV